MVEGFRDEDWMDIPGEEGLNVIFPPRITNIPSAPAALTVGLDEDELLYQRQGILGHESKPSPFQELVFPLNQPIICHNP